MSNWESKNIAEAIGVFAVVLSLLFVGLELRQSSAIARMESYQQFSTAMAEQAGETARDSEFAVLLAKTFQISSSEELTPGEQIQLRARYRSTLYIWSAMYQSVLEGILDPGLLDTIATGGLMNSDFFRESWPALQGNFSPEFVDYINTLNFESRQL